MKNIETLASVSGRLLLKEAFNELKYKRQFSSPRLIMQAWRICTRKNELNKFINQDVTVSHSLGFWSGTALWLQEIINRHYYSSINSFVYLGAALLLTLIGIRRFSDSVDDSVVIIGIIFEALMLIILFLVMFFSPEELDEEEENDYSETEELLSEIGEISTEFATALIKIENINNNISALVNRQDRLIGLMDEIVHQNAQIVSPNTDMLKAMQETSSEIREMKNSIVMLNDATKTLKEENIKFEIKQQIEELIFNKHSK